MSNPPPPDGMNDDFFDQIFSMPAPDAAPSLSYSGDSTAAAAGFAAGGPSMFSIGLSMDQQQRSNSKDTGGKRTPEDSHSHSQFDSNSLSSEPPPEREQHPVQLSALFRPYGHAQLHQIRPNPSPQVAHGQGIQSSMAAASQPPAPRPRARARRGQATDPHSIAERLRREKIAERIRALQELVPSTNKTDRAVMLDEVVDYVKFLRLQVKVLSMSRLGGAGAGAGTGAVAQLVADIPLSSVEGDNSAHQLFDKWSTDGTELQVAKLMEEDIGAAMQLLQSKSLCVMPMSLATAIYHTRPQPGPELNTPSSC